MYSGGVPFLRVHDSFCTRFMDMVVQYYQEMDKGLECIEWVIIDCHCSCTAILSFPVLYKYLSDLTKGYTFSFLILYF